MPVAQNGNFINKMVFLLNILHLKSFVFNAAQTFQGYMDDSQRIKPCGNILITFNYFSLNQGDLRFFSICQLFPLHLNTYVIKLYY